MPSVLPANAMCLPSGLQAGVICCSTAMSMTRLTPPWRTSTMTSARPASRLLAKTASELPSGENAMSRPMRWPRVRFCANRFWNLVEPPLVRLRSMRRFCASNRTRSTSFLTVENAATRSPDGDAIGDSSWLPPPPESASVRNGRPKSLGSPVSTSCGRYFWRSHRRNSASKSSGVDAERPLDRAPDARAQRVPELVEEVAQAVLAPAVFDEVERGVAVAIGEEAAALRLGDRRQHVVDRGVDQEHAVVGGLVLAVVARHAFHEPLRRRRGERLAEAAREQDVVLEDVGQLVADERVELGVGQVDRHHHAEQVGGRERAHALRDEARSSRCSAGSRCASCRSGAAWAPGSGSRTPATASRRRSRPARSPSRGDAPPRGSSARRSGGRGRPSNRTWRSGPCSCRRCRSTGPQRARPTKRSRRRRANRGPPRVSVPPYVLRSQPPDPVRRIGRQCQPLAGR